MADLTAERDETSPLQLCSCRALLPEMRPPCGEVFSFSKCSCNMTGLTRRIDPLDSSADSLLPSACRLNRVLLEGLVQRRPFSQQSTKPLQSTVTLSSSKLLTVGGQSTPGNRQDKREGSENLEERLEGSDVSPNFRCYISRPRTRTVAFASLAMPISVRS